MAPEDLLHARSILDTAKPDDLLVVAALGANGDAAISILNPDARRLVNLASSLLDSAKDLLADSEVEADEDLCDLIREALYALPDRFDDGEGDANAG